MSFWENAAKMNESAALILSHSILAVMKPTNSL